MTPMIDMVFLLLVFFMTVSTLAQADRAKKLDLPPSAQSDVPEAEDLADRGTLSLDADGTIYLGVKLSPWRRCKRRCRRRSQRTQVCGFTCVRTRPRHIARSKRCFRPAQT